MSHDTMLQTDLTNCDREPIHIPGSIQPHGVLLALSEPDLTIIQASANVLPFLGYTVQQLLGKPLNTFLTTDQCSYLQECVANEQVDQNPLYTLTLTIGESRQLFDVIVHRISGLLILELEPSSQSDTTASLHVYRMVKSAISACQRTTAVRTFAQALTVAVRRLTGFDRVMVYQFLPDESGIVIAEDCREGLSSYLDLRYPASDIPRQARALYLRNWLRIIPDVHYQPVPMQALDLEHPSIPLDMSYATLRSVSPIHIEYLKNMGATASMSISLIKNDQLWGLVACHHHSGSHYLSYDVRAACEFLGHIVSLQITDKEMAEDASYTIQIQATQAQLVQHMSTANDVVAGLTRFEPNLMAMIDAGGVAISMEGQCVLLGTTPTEREIWQLIEWIGQNVPDMVFATDSLVHHYPSAAAFKDSASGLLAMRMSRSRLNMILWFRPEVIQLARWGGNPEKPMEVTDEGVILSPRRSFDIWKETVKQTALPWRVCEISAVRDLRRAIIDLVLYRVDELARLNDELTRSNVELDSFAYVASHDLKEPLRGLHNYAHFLIEDYSHQLDDDGKAKLETLIRLTQRMEALIDTLLHYSRVGRGELAWTKADLNIELADVLNLLEPRLRESNVEVRIPRPLPHVRADQSRIKEVFSNLIANAIKYNDKPLRWVEISYTIVATEGNDDDEEPYVFYVRDNGIGIPEVHQETIFRIFKRLHGRDEYGGGVGAGLTIAKKIIERHGGMIWLQSTPERGATFFFTLADFPVDRQTVEYTLTPD